MIDGAECGGEIVSTLGSRLREARERKKLTQIEAAKILGISNGTLSGYERGYRDPDTTTLKKLANLYGVSIDWLSGNDFMTAESYAEYGSKDDQATREVIEAYNRLSPEKKKIVEDLIKALMDTE